MGGQVDDSPPETLSGGSNGSSVCQEENHKVILIEVISNLNNDDSICDAT